MLSTRLLTFCVIDNYNLASVSLGKAIRQLKDNEYQ